MTKKKFIGQPSRQTWQKKHGKSWNKSKSYQDMLGKNKGIK